MLMHRAHSLIYTRRLRAYNKLLVELFDLRAARLGIDYELHPDVYDEIEADIRRKEQRALSLSQKLGA